MSIYSRCSEAAHKLMQNPPEEHGGVFTEIDVVRLAATSNWSTTNYKEALRHANQVVGTLYRARKLARFGPVTLPSGDPDYARIASKVVYASATDGPKSWKTPNGTFKRLMIEDDKIGRQGRRRGTNRNDLAPWDEQEIRRLRPEQDAAMVPELQPEPVAMPSLTLKDAIDRIHELEQELEQRQPCEEVERMVDDRVLAVLGDLEERLLTHMQDGKPIAA